MRNKILIGVGILIGIVIIGSLSNGLSKLEVTGTQITTSIQIPSPSPTAFSSPSSQPILEPSSTPVSDSGLNNNNYYTNSQDNEVHSPAYSKSVPTGATAICGDGSYSFSQSRRGTCSHHGGVSQWL